MKKVAVLFGTRPEAIKMAPVVSALEQSALLEPVIIATAQHREMLDQVLRVFAIEPNHDLNLMQPRQTLPVLTARLITAIDDVMRDEAPAALLVQGDTTSVLAGSLAAFYNGIPVGHVEAGLRTGDMRNPFPEEMNRVVTGRLTRWHFAPTATAAQNLLTEKIPASAVFVTGNTVIDALLAARNHPDKPARAVPEGSRLLLVTAHRRENFGEPLRRICAAICQLLEQDATLSVLFPVHRNPNVSATVHQLLGQHPRITLCEPLDYLAFIAAMEAAHVILSDSGGVQEEAPALGKPVLVLRDETERPEAIASGVAALVGTQTERIVDKVTQLLIDPAAYRQMAKGASPYGDGHAARRIVEILEHELFDTATRSSTVQSHSSLLGDTSR